MYSHPTLGLDISDVLDTITRKQNYSIKYNKITLMHVYYYYFPLSF